LKNENDSRTGVQATPRARGGQEDPPEAQADPAREVPVQEGQGDGEEEVELLFHPQGPGVQQGADLGGVSEVASLDDPPEVDVGQKQGLGDQRPAQVLEVFRKQDQGGAQGHEGRQDHQGRGQPAHAALPEVQEREGPRAVRLEQQAGDQEAREDEEDVHPDVAAREAQFGVVEEDGQDRHGPQSVDIGAVSHGACGFRVRQEVSWRRRADRGDRPSQQSVRERFGVPPRRGKARFSEDIFVAGL